MNDLFSKLSREQLNHMNHYPKDKAHKHECLSKPKDDPLHMDTQSSKDSALFDERITLKEMLVIEKQKQNTSNIPNLLINTLNIDINNKQACHKKINLTSKIFPNSKTHLVNSGAQQKQFKSLTINKDFYGSFNSINSRNANNSNAYSSSKTNSENVHVLKSKKKLNNSCISNEVISQRYKNPYNLNVIFNKYNLNQTTSAHSFKKDNASCAVYTESSSLNRNCKRNNKSLSYDKKKIKEEEDYDYRKLLEDLRSIFGKNLENFDENVLFSNLDEMSNKGLIKGLLMLALQQEKVIKELKCKVKDTKKVYDEENKEKMDSMVILTLQINKLNSLFKGFIEENEQVLEQAKKYK